MTKEELLRSQSSALRGWIESSGPLASEDELLPLL